MKYNRYPKRDAIKNYFPLPKEIFLLSLKPGELAVYAYLLYCEDRQTYQCWLSYRTIGKAVRLSENTVRKCVMALEEKALISTEPTSVHTRPARSETAVCSTPSARFRKRWICFMSGRLRGRSWPSYVNGLRSDWRCPHLSAPVSRCVGLWSRPKGKDTARGVDGEFEALLDEERGTKGKAG